MSARPLSHSKSSARSKYCFACMFMLINVICWGVALPLVKPALAVTTPFRYLFYRFSLASVLSLPILLYYFPKIKHRWRELAIIVGIELIGTTLSLSLLYFGLRQTTAIQASMISTTSPIFLIIVAMLVLHEKEDRREWIGLAIAFISTMLMTLVPLQMIKGQGVQISLLGNALIIGQNIVNAFYFVFAKKFYHHLPKLFVTTVSYYLGFVSFLILSFAEVHFSVAQFVQVIQLDWQSPHVWLAVIYMATFGSIIGLTSIIKGQDGMKIADATMFGYLQPLIYIPLSILLLGEHFQALELLLLLGVIAGVFISEGRFAKYLFPKRKYAALKLSRN